MQCNAVKRQESVERPVPRTHLKLQLLNRTHCNGTEKLLGAHYFIRAILNIAWHSISREIYKYCSNNLVAE